MTDWLLGRGGLDRVTSHTRSGKRRRGPSIVADNNFLYMHDPTTSTPLFTLLLPQIRHIHRLPRHTNHDQRGTRHNRRPGPTACRRIPRHARRCARRIRCRVSCRPCCRPCCSCSRPCSHRVRRRKSKPVPRQRHVRGEIAEDDQTRIRAHRPHLPDPHGMKAVRTGRCRRCLRAPMPGSSHVKHARASSTRRRARRDATARHRVAAGDARFPPVRRRPPEHPRVAVTVVNTVTVTFTITSIGLRIKVGI